MAQGANLAVHRPHHQRVAAVGFEFVQVEEHPRLGKCIARAELARTHLCRREKQYRHALSLLERGINAQN